MGWVRRACDCGRGPIGGVKGQGIVWRPRMGMEPDTVVKGFVWVSRT